MITDEQYAAECAAVGESVLLFVAKMDRLGHEGPGGSLHYGPPSPAADLARWARHDPGWEEARTRLRAVAEGCDMERRAAAILGRTIAGALMPAESPEGSEP